MDLGSYSVVEGEAARKNPMVFIMVRDVLGDASILDETLGLGPKGWVLDSYRSLKVLIAALDSEGIDDASFEYSVDGGSWITVTPTLDLLMAPLNDLLQGLNDIVDRFRELAPELDLPSISPSLKLYAAEVPGQPTGHYVMFRAKATDTDGNLAESPMGLYYTVNQDSNVRVLIVDPHVKLWLFQQNVEELAQTLMQHIDYQLPGDLTGNMTLINKIADVIDNHGIQPFHHWELLGKHYSLYITWPDAGIADLLKSRTEGGFEPHAIILSNLVMGFNGTDELSFWNWDLKDQGVLDNLIQYIKEKHAGLIATHGTLSDWVVWTSPEPSEHYKIGCRGHVGESPSDLNPIEECTIAALLGLPELALWEYARDAVAYALCADPYTEPLGLLVGSTPLQVPHVPFNGTMKLTGEAEYVGWDLPDKFTVTVPSVYNEFGFNAYTQVGWQLAMPRALAYIAWWKANETRPMVEQLYAKLSGLVENATSKMVSRENVTKLTDEALSWALSRLYRSIINASIEGNTFNVTLRLPGQNETFRLAVDVGRNAYEKLLQLLPVKLIALSKDGLSAIIAHDKYWDQNGYRAVYFAFEAEAAEGEIAEKLLTQAVNWTIRWSFKNVTELLGNLVRVPTNLAESFKGKLNELPGNVAFSDGIILVEEGSTTVKVNASSAGFLHVVIAHPTSDKVNVTVAGEVEAQQTVNVTKGLTYVTLKVYGAGTVNLEVKADPESSLNPAYISAKQEADITPPSIGAPYQEPPEDNVQPDQAVTVSVNVTDTQMGVREVVLSYSTDEGATWTNVTMSRVDGDTYIGQIPGFPAGTNVQYMIIAYDNAGNCKVENNGGQYYVYTVIPEFPTWPLLLLMLIVLSAVIILLKKRPRSRLNSSRGIDGRRTNLAEKELKARQRFLGITR